MSAPRTTRRTTAIAAAASVAASVLLGLSGAAAADPGASGDGSTLSDHYENYLPGQPAREPHILEFDWRSPDMGCLADREPQILEFDWRHAYVACNPIP
jgi:hypothetical protein